MTPASIRIPDTQLRPACFIHLSFSTRGHNLNNPVSNTHSCKTIISTLSTLDTAPIYSEKANHSPATCPEFSPPPPIAKLPSDFIFMVANQAILPIRTNATKFKLSHHNCRPRPHRCLPIRICTNLATFLLEAVPTLSLYAVQSNTSGCPPQPPTSLPWQAIRECKWRKACTPTDS